MKKKPGSALGDIRNQARSQDKKALTTDKAQESGCREVGKVALTRAIYHGDNGSAVNFPFVVAGKVFQSAALVDWGSAWDINTNHPDFSEDNVYKYCLVDESG